MERSAKEELAVRARKGIHQSGAESAEEVGNFLSECVILSHCVTWGKGMGEGKKKKCEESGEAHHRECEGIYFCLSVSFWVIV